MLSGMGRNVQFYCERFGTSLYGAVILVKERKHLADEEMIWRAYMIKELVMVRDGVCCLSWYDVSALTLCLSVDRFLEILFIVYLLYNVYVYFEYNLQ